MSEFFYKVIETYPQDIAKIYYYLLYKLGPSYLIPDLEIPVDKLEALVQRILGISEPVLINYLKQTSDLGQVCYDIKKKSELIGIGAPARQKKLKLYEIMNILEEAALESENSKQNNKINLIYSIMTRTDKDELKFLVCFLEKNLKLGISRNLIFNSLSRAISRILVQTYEKDVYKIITKSLNQLGIKTYYLAI